MLDSVIDIGAGDKRRRVRVRELIVSEVRDWLQALATEDPDVAIDLADYLLFEDAGIRLVDFARMTDLSSQDLESLAPSDLESVLAKCREVNPRFFRVLDRVLATGRLAMQRPVSTPSSKPAPSSPGWFTRMFTRGRGAD